jgi:hypothetical protein
MAPLLILLALLCSALSEHSAARVTGLGEFSPMGDYLLWAFFENYRRSPNFGATIFSGKSNVLISTKNGFGHFGRFFHKHIWSPCLRPTLMGLRWLLFTCALPRNGLTNSSQIQHSGNYQNSKKKNGHAYFSCLERIL